jgi:hypothetical protein
MFNEAIPTIESQDQDNNLEVLVTGTGCNKRTHRTIQTAATARPGTSLRYGRRPTAWPEGLWKWLEVSGTVGGWEH